MLPVSPVFYTEQQWVLVLKMYSEWEHPFYYIRYPCCEAEHAKTFMLMFPWVINVKVTTLMFFMSGVLAWLCLYISKV